MGQTRPRRIGYGGAIVAGCLAFAICRGLAATAVGSRPAVPMPPPIENAVRMAPIVCASELYAFMKVAEAARDLAADRGILNFALDDLQANLVDCLKGDDGEERRDMKETLPRLPPRNLSEIIDGSLLI